MSKRLCLFCVWSLSSGASHCELVLPGSWAPKRVRYLLDGQGYEWDLHPGINPLHGINGRPGALADLVQKHFPELNEDIFFIINGQRIRIWAETNLFGLELCYNHVHDGIEIWKSGRRLNW